MASTLLASGKTRLPGSTCQRRQLLRWLTLPPALGLLPITATSLLAPLPVHATSAPFQARRLLMGTWVDITVANSAQPGLADAVALAFKHMGSLATMMSRFDPHGALAALNAAAGRAAVAVPPELMRVLHLARQLSAQTGGAFDITVGALTGGGNALGAGDIPDDNTVKRALTHIKPQRLDLNINQHTAYINDPLTQLDLGGIAKLPILEAGLGIFKNLGIDGVMINGGGDVLASARQDGQLWRIGVRDPAQPEKLLAVLPLQAGVVASSGDYERFVMHEGLRYHHIIDPHTGRPTRGVHGVTLVANTVAQVNGLGAAAMVAGPRHGPALLTRLGVLQALLVGTDGQVWLSPSLAGRLQAPPGQPRVRGLA